MTTLAVAGSDDLTGLRIAQALSDHGVTVREYAVAPTLEPRFSQVFPDAHRRDDPLAVATSTDAELVIVAPEAGRRASVAIAAMHAGHPVVTDAPTCTTLEQLDELRHVSATTGRRCLTVYPERFSSRAVLRTIELVRAGAVGEIVELVAFGPHPHHPHVRPESFYDPSTTGGILTDLGTHPIDQFLELTDGAEVDVVHASVRNVSCPGRPGWNDVGTMTLTVGDASAYARVDWLSAPGLPAWGDVRLFVTGTAGSIEARPLVDVGGQGGPDHVFLVNGDTAGRIDCDDVALDWAPRLVADLLDGTGDLVTPDHCFRVAEAALAAQARAARTPSPA